MNSSGKTNKDWVCNAIREINASFNRTSDTHLIKLPTLRFDNIDIYLKDESTHPTGSLKHRLARSLFLYGLCNGLIHEGTTIVEASSGSTAISEAYFSTLLGLKFIAVIPEKTAEEKIKQIEFYGGTCVKVPSCEIYAEAEALAAKLNGHYMDQFTYAERATDWRGNNNIAESIFDQMKQERFPIPSYIVMSAGTGGTSATIGRYIRYNPEYYLKTQLVVPDPEGSVFYEYFHQKNPAITSTQPSRIEGIGRPRVEPSFLPSVVDEMIKVPDAASIATIRWLEKVLGRKCGGSTGTNLYATLHLAKKMQQEGQEGSLVSMICDSGERYLNTYYNDDWVAEQNMELGAYIDELDQWLLFS